MKTIHINWYGPFTLEEIDKNFENEKEINRRKKDSLYRNGFYVWTGKTQGQHSEHIQYIGITERAFVDRFWATEHKNWYIAKKDKKVWIGKITNAKTTREDFEDAEYILVSYCKRNNQARLNEKKTNLPQFSCTVISSFFKKDESRYEKVPSIIRAISEVVIWDAETGEIRDVQKLNRYTPQ